MSNATVSVISFNNIAHTKRCLAAIFACGGSPQVILTNNGSTDGTKEYFDALAHQKRGYVRVVHNATNEGFIEPNRSALKMTDTELFVMVNNDCIVSEGWLHKLASPLLGNAQAALSAPECCASRLRDDMGGYRCSPREMEYLEGSCLMTKTALMKEHGLFSPDLHFAYGEDSDLGLRMRMLGYTLHAVPNVHIIHEGGATSTMVPNINQYEVANHAASMARWAVYLKARVFDAPIVVRRQAAMGDALLITPIIDALAIRFPKSPIHVETQFVDLFMHNPKVQSVTRNKYPGGKHLLVNLDMAYENEPGAHIIEGYRQAAQNQTGTQLVVDRRTTIVWDADPFGHNFLSGHWVGIHCEPTTWPGKNWPSDRWAQVIEWLRAQGLKVALVGASKETHVPFDLDLRTFTAPLDLAAALSHCVLFIGHDSFPLHVAQSQGVPVVGLFGATRAEFILTDGSPAIGINGESECAGARHRTPGLTYVPCDASCMSSIAVEQVQKAVEKMLSITEVLA